MIEAAPNSVVRVYFLLKDLGLGGIPGESPTIVIRRRRDGLYLQSGGASFAGAAAQIPMVEEDALLLPGLYHFDLDLALADPSATDEYTAYMANDNPPKSGSALDVIFVKNEIGFAPGSTRGVYLFVSNVGSPLGVVGLTPEVAIQRESDGRFLDSSIPAFVSGPALFSSMTELDQANMPGVYRFNFDQSVDGSIARYVAYVKELNGLEKIVEASELDFRAEAQIAAGGLDFAGIEELADNGFGGLCAKASLITTPYEPLRYKVFIAPTSEISQDSDLFVDAYLLGEFRVPEVKVFTMADAVTPLRSLTSYTVGMRALDAREVEDDNEVTIALELTADARVRLSTGTLRTLQSPNV